MTKAKTAAKNAANPASARAGTAVLPEGSVGTLVHAYRRQPHMKDDGTGKLTEQDVEVVCYGEKIKFRSNAEGHIVGLVRSEDALHRLVKEIPEAYIVYAGGDNVPEAPVTDVGTARPDGDFVLEKNTTTGKEFVKLDDMSDEELRDLADEAGLEDEQLPDALTGEALKRTIYNLLSTGS
jgi:hypothetical protein